MSSPSISFGPLLRSWRTRRRLSQQNLAAEAAISTRHLSCLETERASPSREMVLRLSDQLHLPIREQNQLLLAAGYAPIFPQHSLSDPQLSYAQQAVQQVLQGHGPFPALAVDRHWQLLAANAALGHLIADVSPELLQPPVNVLRLSLHPRGLASKIENYDEWRTHLLTRLSREIELTADPALAKLRAELAGYPVPAGSCVFVPAGTQQLPIVIPLHLNLPVGKLALFSTTTVFGTPLDVTLAELAIETFFPLDAPSAQLLQQLAEQAR